MASREDIVKHAKGLGFPGFEGKDISGMTKQQFNAIGNKLNDYKASEGVKAFKDNPNYVEKKKDEKPKWQDKSTEEGKAAEQFHKSDEGKKFLAESKSASSDGRTTTKDISSPLAGLDKAIVSLELALSH